MYIKNPFKKNVDRSGVIQWVCVVADICITCLTLSPMFPYDFTYQSFSDANFLLPAFVSVQSIRAVYFAEWIISGLYLMKMDG